VEQYQLQTKLWPQNFPSEFSIRSQGAVSKLRPAHRLLHEQSYVEKTELVRELACYFRLPRSGKPTRGNSVGPARSGNYIRRSLTCSQQVWFAGNLGNACSSLMASPEGGIGRTGGPAKMFGVTMLWEVLCLLAESVAKRKGRI
jgi:hypothetical protein